MIARFLEVQPVTPSGQLQIQINNTADLIHNFDNMGNTGDQIEMFYSIAESQPDVAVIAFSTIVRNPTSQSIKALAVQGFGKLSDKYKQPLASCVSKESQELLKFLGNEINERKNDLTVWATAQTIREMKFNLANVQHPQGGNLSDPPRRIQNEILERKIQEIKKIKRFDTRGKFTADYERFLEFWIYGPIDEFFNENRSDSDYLAIVEDILLFTQITGGQLGLKATTERVQELSYNHLKSIFEKYSNCREDSFKKDFGNSLSRFLINPNVNDLQKLVDAMIFKFQLPDMNTDETPLEQRTLTELNKYVYPLNQAQSQVNKKFSDAIEVSCDLNLNQFLGREQETYLQEVTKLRNELRNLIALKEQRNRKMEAQRQKILSNTKLLGEVFMQCRGVDSEFFDGNLINLQKEFEQSKSRYLPRDPRELLQTYEVCQAFNNILTKIKNTFLSLIDNIINDLTRQAEDSTIFWGELFLAIFGKENTKQILSNKAQKLRNISNNLSKQWRT